MTDQPALKFNSDLYTPEVMGTILDQFREKGWARLPQLFERESVDAFVEQVHRARFHNGLEWTLPDDQPIFVWAAQAPRIRQVIVPAMSYSVAPPVPSLFLSVWIIQPVDTPQVVPKWHKDRQPEGMPGNQYHYPDDVFVAMYFEDMTEECGPALIVPGSHRDGAITPWSGEPHEAMLGRKEDGILLDQRAWHCGMPRTLPGTRLTALYGYFPVPLFYGAPLRMPRAQRDAWMKAGSREDQGFWGGIFRPPDRP